MMMRSIVFALFALIVTAAIVEAEPSCGCVAVDDAPVCALGKTFANLCTAKCHLNVDEDLVQDGACPEHEMNCKCSTTLSPVCFRGKSYGNACLAICNGAKRNQVQPGRCNPLSRRCWCPYIYEPVCFMGETFVNRCMAKCKGAIERFIDDGECWSFVMLEERVIILIMIKIIKINMMRNDQLLFALNSDFILAR